MNYRYSSRRTTTLTAVANQTDFHWLRLFVRLHRCFESKCRKLWRTLSREAQPLQELRVTLVRAQSFQYRVDFHERQAAVVLSIGAVHPRKCAVRIITIGVYLSDLACPLVLAIGDKLLQSGI